MRQQRIGFRMIVVTGGALLMLLPAFIAGWIYTGKLQQEAESLVASGLRPRGPDTEPLRFIDFAAPTHGLDGSVAGVVGIHVNWDWVTNQLASLAGPGVEILLLSRDRQVLFGPADLVGNHLGIGGAVAAGQAKAFVRAERWPDGKDYKNAV